jgi:hypothetical protein
MLLALASALAALGRSDARVGQDEGFRGVRSKAGQDALRAICDLKKPIRVLPLAFGSPKRLEVALSSELGPFTLGWAEPRRFRCLVPISLYRRREPRSTLMQVQVSPLTPLGRVGRVAHVAKAAH